MFCRSVCVFAAFSLIGLTGCLKSQLDYNPNSLDENSQGSCSNPDGIACKIVNNHGNLIVDDFERADVFDNSIPALAFGWRKIINDNGQIIDGEAGNHVDMQIYSEDIMGPAASGQRALYSFGRQGHSIHNIYLISKTFNIDAIIQGETAIIEFDYLTLDLDNANEYLRLEVCNNTAENCGVGDNLNLGGLNDRSKWQTVFEVSANSLGEGLDGTNHVLSDWLTEKVVLFLEDFQRSEFIFRFNARMDEGFKGNNILNGMEDGVAIDRVRATAYDIDDDVVENVDMPEEILEIEDEGVDPSNF